MFSQFRFIILRIPLELWIAILQIMSNIRFVIRTNIYRSKLSYLKLQEETYSSLKPESYSDIQIATEKQKEKLQSLEKKIFIFRQFDSWWMYVGVFMIFTIGWFVYQITIGIFYSSYGNCLISYSRIFYSQIIFQSIFYLFVVFCGYASLIIDFLLFHRFNGYAFCTQYFRKEDPYLFRLEFFCVLFWMLFGALLDSYGTYGTYMLQNYQKKDYSEAQLILVSLNVIYKIGLMFFIGGNVFLITFSRVVNMRPYYRQQQSTIANQIKPEVVTFGSEISSNETPISSMVNVTIKTHTGELTPASGTVGTKMPSMSSRNIAVSEYDDLECLLDDLHGYSLFIQFAQTELSQENVIVYSQIKTFKQFLKNCEVLLLSHDSSTTQNNNDNNNNNFMNHTISSSSSSSSSTKYYWNSGLNACWKRAQNIVECFLDKQAPIDLNISATLKENVVMKWKDLNKMIIIHSDSKNNRKKSKQQYLVFINGIGIKQHVMNELKLLFNGVLDALILNMKDTFWNFRRTPQYQQWLKQMELSNK